MRKELVLASVALLALCAAGPASAAARVLLVDDDASGNNLTVGGKTLSPSDSFYRAALQKAGFTFDTVVVDANSDGPTAETLAGHDLVLWYTGGSYGGAADHRSTVSLRDEESLASYVRGGGALILVSPGYASSTMWNQSQWDKVESRFIQEVLGLKGGKGLVKRFEAGRVVASTGAGFEIGLVPGNEIQFSALNPETARPVFTADLAVNDKGAQSTPVATANQAGSGRVVYVAFTLENVTGDPAAPFAVVLSAAGVTPGSGGAAPMPPRKVLAPRLEITGLGILSTEPPMPPREVTAPELTVTGTGSLN